MPIGTSAASAELSGSGSITGFTTATTSGVLLAIVICNNDETNTTGSIFTFGDLAGLTWGFVGAFTVGGGGGNTQSIFLYSAPFSSQITNDTITKTNHVGIVSARQSFMVVECESSQNSFEGVIGAATLITGSANSKNLGGQTTRLPLTTQTDNAGQNQLHATTTGISPTNVLLVNPGGATQEWVFPTGASAGIITCQNNLVHTHFAGETVQLQTAVTTLNANDMILGIMESEAGGTDTIVGAGSFTTAISTQNFHANTCAAAGVVYQDVTSAGTYNPSATDTNGGVWISCTIAIKAAPSGTPAPYQGVTVIFPARRRRRA